MSHSRLGSSTAYASAFVAIAAFSAFVAVPAHGQELLVSGFTSDEVHRFDYATGNYLGALAAANGAHAVVTGADGLLYIAVEEDDKVVRYDPATLLFHDEFVFDDPVTPQDDTGGLDGPTGLAFGADGRLYVSSFNTDSILRYDGTTGAFDSVFVATGSGGLDGPDAGTTFGPDGHLYVPSYFNHRVLRYDGMTGALIGDFFPAGSGGLRNPRTLRFRSDGVLYLTGEGNGRVMRYDETGGFIDAFIRATGATGFVLSPFDGHVYVASVTNDNVVVFDGDTGARIRTLVTPGDGGLDAAVWVAFLHDPDVHLGRIAPGTVGVVNSITVRNATPSSLQYLIVGTKQDSIEIPNCPGMWLGMSDPILFPITTDAAGAATVSAFVDPALSGATLRLQCFDPTSCRMSNLVVQSFP